MSCHSYKLIELVGSSVDSTDDAIKNAIGKAAMTIKHMDWFEVVETRGPYRGWQDFSFPGNHQGRVPDRGLKKAAPVSAALKRDQRN